MTPTATTTVAGPFQIDIASLFYRVVELLSGSSVNADTIIAWLAAAWFYFSLISFLLSGLFIFGIIYSYLRIGEYNEIIANKIANDEKLWREVHSGDQGDRRWKEIKAHVSSTNPNDWKLAIIEADIMLGEALNQAGYAGLTIGDKLKGSSPTQFTTLQDAWDAHRIRNRIAHEGADFVLTQHMAHEAIVKYERVFREFGKI